MSLSAHERLPDRRSQPPTPPWQRPPCLLLLLFLIGALLFALPALRERRQFADAAEKYNNLREAVQREASYDKPVLLPVAPSIAEAIKAIEATVFPSAAPEEYILPTALSTSAPPDTLTGAHLAACQALNTDFAAWLQIPDTPIDYPVVQSDNTDYYLHHLFTGQQSRLGCLFSLPNADYQTPGKNIAIYGHHLSASQAMFSTLTNYKQESYWRQHPFILLDSLHHSAKYQIFAVLNMKVSEWDAATAVFASDDAFLRFVRRAQKRALYDTGITIAASDCILTLITCDRSYGGVSGRLIVMAVEMDGRRTPYV